ncbi:MAG: hypothetical protein Tsb002_25700 [Wenzhouxiangellaceae bacterium]
MIGTTAIGFPALLLGILLAGFAGSLHCLGMCGPLAAVLGGQASTRSQQAAYQTGRIGGYMVLGMLGASVLGWLSGAGNMLLAGQLLRLLLALALIILGSHLLFNWPRLARISHLGAGLWRYLQPLARHWLPPRHSGHAFMLGLLWGWLPCGMVYAFLGVAWSTASAWQAGAVMLMFGLGTTPLMLSSAVGAQWLRQRLGQSGLRRLAGALLLAAGLLSLGQFAYSLLVSEHSHHHATHSHAQES